MEEERYYDRYDRWERDDFVTELVADRELDDLDRIVRAREDPCAGCHEDLGA